MQKLRFREGNALETFEGCQGVMRAQNKHCREFHSAKHIFQLRGQIVPIHCQGRLTILKRFQKHIIHAIVTVHKEPRPKDEELMPQPKSAIPEGDLYALFKQKEGELAFLDVQERYVKDEIKNLKRELIRAKEEVARIQSVPLVIGQFNEMVDGTYGIASSTAGSVYYVRVLSTLDREKLKPNSSVALHRHSHSVVDVLPPESDSTVQLMLEKPKVSYKDIGGLEGRLGNPGFADKAPADVVEATRAQLAEKLEQKATLDASIAELEKQ